jgi:hypothetical protein
MQNLISAVMFNSDLGLLYLITACIPLGYQHINMYRIFLLFIAILCRNVISAQTDSSKNLMIRLTLKTVTVTAFGGSANWKDAPLLWL